MEPRGVYGVDLRQVFRDIVPNISVEAMDELCEYGEEFVRSRSSGESRFRAFVKWLMECQMLDAEQVCALIIAAVNIRCGVAPGRIHG